MVDVEYMHVCDYAFSAQGGKPSVIGIFETIQGGSFPITHPHMCIAVQLRAQPHARVPVVVELAKPNGEVLGRIDGEVPASSEGGCFIHLTMVNMVFPEAGRYAVKVSSEGRPLASQSIRVQKMKVTAPTPAQPAH
jgi:hypothetical protein